MSEYDPGSPHQDPDHPRVNMNGRCRACGRPLDDHCILHTKAPRPVCPQTTKPACGPDPN